MDSYMPFMMSLMGLVILCNIIVEVAKRATADKLPTNLVALVVSQVVTLAYCAAVSNVYAVAVTWYMVLGWIAMGFLVAYGAMFGWDKLQQTLGQLAGLRGKEHGK